MQAAGDFLSDPTSAAIVLTLVAAGLAALTLRVAHAKNLRKLIPVKVRKENRK